VKLFFKCSHSSLSFIRERKCTRRSILNIKNSRPFFPQNCTTRSELYMRFFLSKRNPKAPPLLWLRAAWKHPRRVISRQADGGATEHSITHETCNMQKYTYSLHTILYKLDPPLLLRAWTMLRKTFLPAESIDLKERRIAARESNTKPNLPAASL
jgi:hypothetical protein